MYVAITASAAAVSTRHQRSKVKALGLALGNKVNKGSGAWEAAIVLSILGYGSTHTHTHTHTLDRESSHKQAATTAQPHFHPQGEVVRKMSSCEMKWNKKAQTQTWWWDYIQEFLIFNNVLSLRNINEVRKDKKKPEGSVLQVFITSAKARRGRSYISWFLHQRLTITRSAECFKQCDNRKKTYQEVAEMTIKYLCESD